MNPEEYERLNDVEGRHWFYRGKRDIVRQWIQRFVPLNETTPLLDIGTGTGLFVEEMSRLCPAVGLDDHAEALTLARRRSGPHFIQGTSAPLPFRDDSFAATTALDVIEHLDDDRAALAEMVRVTRPGGLIVITVPAFMLLWSDWDVALHHRRRYRRGQLLQLAKDAGLDVMTCRYINSLVFAPVLLYRRMRQWTGWTSATRAEDRVPSDWLNSLLYQAFVQTAVARPNLFPFGVSVLAVLRKPEPGKRKTAVKDDRLACVPGEPS